MKLDLPRMPALSLSDQVPTELGPVPARRCSPVRHTAATQDPATSNRLGAQRDARELRAARVYIEPQLEGDLAFGVHEPDISVTVDSSGHGAHLKASSLAGVNATSHEAHHLQHRVQAELSLLQSVAGGGRHTYARSSPSCGLAVGSKLLSYTCTEGCLVDCNSNSMPVSELTCTLQPCAARWAAASAPTGPAVWSQLVKSAHLS